MTHKIEIITKFIKKLKREEYDYVRGFINLQQLRIIELEKEVQQSKTKEPELDSTYIIGNVKEHYKNVFREDRRWDVWRAFYNGWIDGRSKMAIDMIKLRKKAQEDDWINVSDGLPELVDHNNTTTSKVIVEFDGFVTIGFMYKEFMGKSNVWFTVDNTFDEEEIHPNKWKHLPKN